MFRTLAFAAVLTAGCGAEPPAPARDTSSVRERGLRERAEQAETSEAEAAVEVRPGVRIDRILAASGDLSSVLDRLRPPRARRADPVSNRHVAGQIDTLRTWRYDGLDLEIYQTADGRSLLQRLAVTSGTYGTSDGLSVGEARGDLEGVLGPPASERGAEATYRIGEPMPTVIRVVYDFDEDGIERAFSIEWRPPIG